MTGWMTRSLLVDKEYTVYNLDCAPFLFHDWERKYKNSESLLSLRMEMARLYRYSTRDQAMGLPCPRRVVIETSNSHVSGRLVRVTMRHWAPVQPPLTRRAAS